jgi:hypothetical protein
MDIDVTDVLLDPMIAGERFTVLRRRELVNNLGVAEWQWETFPNIIGSVTPTGDQSLVRDEGFQAQAKTILVITAFKLRGESKDEARRNYQPDVVVWNENYYMVRTVDDYSRYGAGFVQAECSSTDLVDQAPR